MFRPKIRDDNFGLGEKCHHSGGMTRWGLMYVEIAINFSELRINSIAISTVGFQFHSSLMTRGFLRGGSVGVTTSKREKQIMGSGLCKFDIFNVSVCCNYCVDVVNGCTSYDVSEKWFDFGVKYWG
jgi:hypothetical protein